MLSVVLAKLFLAVFICCCFFSKILSSGFTTALKVHRRIFRKPPPSPLEMMEEMPLTAKWKVREARFDLVARNVGVVARNIQAVALFSERKLQADCQMCFA